MLRVSARLLQHDHYIVGWSHLHCGYHVRRGAGIIAQPEFQKARIARPGSTDLSSIRADTHWDPQDSGERLEAIRRAVAVPSLAFECGQVNLAVAKHGAMR